MVGVGGGSGVGGGVGGWGNTNIEQGLYDQ